MSAYELYLQYDWDNDQKWNQYKLNIVIPPNKNEELAEERVKRRWYSRNIDSSVDFPPLPDDEQPSPTNNREYSSNTSNSTAYSAPNNDTDYGTDSDNPPPEYPTSSSLPQSGIPPSVPFSPWAFKIIYAIWLAANIFLIINSILYVFTGSPTNYFIVLLSTALTCITNVLSIYGKPQMNKMWFASLFLNDSTHYVLLCLLCIFSPPQLILIIVFTIYAVFNIVSNLLQMLPTLGNPTYTQKVVPILMLVSIFKPKGEYIASYLEVLLMPLLIFQLFTGQSSIAMVFFYWQFLTHRYCTNANTKTLITNCVGALDGIVYTYVPNPIQSIYQKVRGWLGSLVTTRAAAYAQRNY